jgi:uncharacterized protein
MISLTKAKNKLKALKPKLMDKFSVKTIEVFGSYARGEQTERSDLDVLVTFSEPNDVDLLKFIELRLLLKDELGIDVDLVEKDAVKPRLRQRILEEAIQI